MFLHHLRARLASLGDAVLQAPSFHPESFASALCSPSSEHAGHTAFLLPSPLTPTETALTDTSVTSH